MLPTIGQRFLIRPFARCIGPKAADRTRRHRGITRHVRIPVRSFDSVRYRISGVALLRPAASAAERSRSAMIGTVLLLTSLTKVGVAWYDFLKAREPFFVIQEHSHEHRRPANHRG